MTAARALIIIALACLLAAPAQAQSHEGALQAYRRGDFKTAAELWQPLAKDGHGSAQYHLGLLYEYGRGVDRNDATALNWYRAAAAQDVAGAQYRLGVLHDNGWGVELDDAKAVKWFRKAAHQGHAYAQFDLGLMLAEGIGVARDEVRAVMWLSLAIVQGNGHMIKHWRRITKDMTPEQLAQSHRLAREWSAGQDKR